MKNSLLQYLACPSCGGVINLLVVGRTEASEIMEGDLVCAGCARRFPISRGIPRFADPATAEGDQRATAESFGWQWQHFTQQDEKYAEQFLEWIAPVTPEFFRNKVVLEGGCGKGRHSQLAARWGARAIIGVDLSAAVETAFSATRGLENAHIVQADIYRLPFGRNFDYAFSVGVLHHLPDPRAGFQSLAGRVKPGGHISAWVYGLENNEWIVRWVNPVRRHVTSRLSRRLLLHLSRLPTAVLFLATRLIYGPLNRARGGTALARHLFYNDYLKAISHFGWREQHSIVFDHLAAPVAFYISRREFEQWWSDVSACDVVIEAHNGNSWRGWGRISGPGLKSPLGAQPL